MLTFKQVDTSYFPQYDTIPMRLTVKSYYRIEKIDRGLGGFMLVETPTPPYVKDFCTGEDVSVARWGRFTLENWAFFMAFDEELAVGAATVASRCKKANMLAGRDDLAVLWDLRVAESHQKQGVGQKLFDMAVEWAREQRLVQLKIECQANNVPAIKFYHKQGAELAAINEYAGYNDYADYNAPEYSHEAQFIWFLEL
ncbi:MAG: GNAT family N-acetyltransferase [Defluviitaleaceae bacterium]|nr:GNAT family N-acetyltransferase [Defluviitaleaceae bacterium]